ncbi:uncharacterized protein LOC135926700 [Gordionus sp. m RMFG-2023]|uniref:uncharacterized protein LOC135926700 n=1 Tax=Gordionus sp. m RMFG-2023 TaxID=3053472 RepID=UPI0031FC1CAA
MAYNNIKNKYNIFLLGKTEIFREPVSWYIAISSSKDSKPYLIQHNENTLTTLPSILPSEDLISGSGNGESKFVTTSVSENYSLPDNTIESGNGESKFLTEETSGPKFTCETEDGDIINTITAPNLVIGIRLENQTLTLNLEQETKFRGKIVYFRPSESNFISIQYIL